MKEESVGVIGVGENDEMTGAWGGMGRVWIGRGDFGPAEGVGVEEPETVICDGVVVLVKAAMDDKVWGGRAGAGGGSMGVSWGGNEEGIGGCVFEREGWIAGVRLGWWCICCFGGG